MAARVQWTEAALLAMQPGSSRVYHTGELWCDRQRQAVIDRRAALVSKLAACGAGSLIQRRIGPGRFQYLFVRGRR